MKSYWTYICYITAYTIYIYIHYGHFNAFFGWHIFILLFFIKIIVPLDSTYFKHIKRLQVQVSIPFNAKEVGIIRLLVTGGGHLEFSHEKVDGKLEKGFFRVLLSEKTQLFKIYMKKSQNDTMTYTSLRNGAISNNHRFTVTPIDRRSTHTASSRSVMSYSIMTG